MTLCDRRHNCKEAQRTCFDRARSAHVVDVGQVDERARLGSGRRRRRRRGFQVVARQLAAAAPQPQAGQEVGAERRCRGGGRQVPGRGTGVGDGVAQRVGAPPHHGQLAAVDARRRRQVVPPAVVRRRRGRGQHRAWPGGRERRRRGQGPGSGHPRGATGATTSDTGHRLRPGTGNAAVLVVNDDEIIRP